MIWASSLQNLSSVTDKVRFKPVCSEKETNEKMKISLIASLDMILSIKRITKALIRLHGCAGWSVHLLFANPEDRSSHVKAHFIVAMGECSPIPALLYSCEVSLAKAAISPEECFISTALAIVTENKTNQKFSFLGPML